MFSFEKRAAGIDIADRSLEIVEINRQDDQITVTNKFRTEIEPGIVENGSIVKPDKLAEIIQKLIFVNGENLLKAERFVFGMPDNQVFTHIFEISQQRKKLMTSLIPNEVQISIPIKAEDLMYNYCILNEDATDKDIRILIIAVRKSEVIKWQKFWEKLNIKVEIFDIETLAIYRGLFKEKISQPVCLVDVGSVNTIISVFNPNGLFYSFDLKCAGDNLTQKIIDYNQIKGNKLSWADAENIKKASGILDLPAEQSLTGVLKETLKPIIEEIFQTLKFYQQKTGEQVAELIFLGGTCQMPGIYNFLSSFFSSTTISQSQKDFLIHDSNPDDASKDYSAGELKVSLGKIYLEAGLGIEYIEAFGFARRGADVTLPNDLTVPTLSLKEEEGKVKKVQEKIKSNQDKKKYSLWFHWAQEHRREMQLAAVVFIGIIVVIASFAFRSYSAKKAINMANNDLFPNKKIIEYQLPLLLDTTERKADKINVKTYRRTIKEPMEYDAALALAEFEANKKIVNGEKVWPEPLNKVTDKNKLIFPLEINLLIYPENDCRTIFINKIKNIIKQEFLINSFAITGISRDEKTGNYLMSSKIEIAAKNVIDDKDIAAITGVSSSTKEINSISTSTIIQNQPRITTNSESVNESSSIPTAALADKAIGSSTEAISQKVRVKEEIYVRTGPGKSYSPLGKTKPGTIYEFIEEKDGYYKVRLNEKDTAWLMALYMEKIQ